MLMEVDFWPVIWNVLSLRVFLILIFLVIRRVFCIIVVQVCLSERGCIPTRSYSYAWLLTN